MNDAPSDVTTRAERRAARLNDPRFDRFRSTTARRRLVVTMAAMIAAEGVLLALSGPLGSTAAALAAAAGVLVLVVAFVLCLGALKASTRGVEELGPDQLDERQMQVRGVVYAQAYKIGSGFVFALLAAAAVWSSVSETYPPASVLVAVMLVAFHLAIVLPTLVAAWHERV